MATFTFTGASTAVFGGARPVRRAKPKGQHEARKPIVCERVGRRLISWPAGENRCGEVRNGRTFNTAAAQVVRAHEVISVGARSAKHKQDHLARLHNHLIPFFGAKGLPEILSGLVQEYRIERLQGGGKPPACSTMLHEIVTRRQLLKTALRHGWLDRLPNFSAPRAPLMRRISAVTTPSSCRFRGGSSATWVPSVSPTFPFGLASFQTGGWNRAQAAGIFDISQNRQV